MADPSALNDKESNMKVDLLPDVGRTHFISLVKQRGRQSEHESMNNSRTFFLGNCLSLSYEGNGSRSGYQGVCRGRISTSEN